MTPRAWMALAAAVGIAALAGCATPPPVIQPDEDEEPMLLSPPPTPMVEYPPIEPVEPPAPATEPAQATRGPELAPPEVPPAPAPLAPPEVPPETLELMALLADLQRYGAMPPEDVRRELGTATQALTRQRTDANRVRLAVLYSLTKNSPQDDQRALQLLDNVAKNGAGSPAVKQVASVLQAQIAERQRAVRDEQVKADAAIQKLEALRAMERSLLRDRIRSGGGGGAGGAGGTGSGSSGGGGAGGGGAGGGGR
jgi:uncharacterized membrane protein YgcG